MTTPLRIHRHGGTSRTPRRNVPFGRSLRHAPAWPWALSAGTDLT